MDSPGDDRTAELQAALDRFNAAWADRDLEGLVAQFVPDPDLVLLGSEQGEAARGPAELRRLLAFFFEEPVTYRWDWHRRDVYWSGDLAWVVAEGPIVEAGPEGAKQLEYRISGVLERRDGRWLWRLFHGSAPDPPHADWPRIVQQEA